MNAREARRDFATRQVENMERRIAMRAERAERDAIATSASRAARRARDQDMMERNLRRLGYGVPEPVDTRDDRPAPPDCVGHHHAHGCAD